MLALTLTMLVFLPAQEEPTDPSRIVAQAGGEDILEAHVRLAALLAGHSSLTPRLRQELLRRLVENRLVARHLHAAGYQVGRAELAQAYRDERARLLAGGIDLRAELKKLGLDESDVRRELETGKLWTQYKVRNITDKLIRQRFLEHRARYDGTRLRASQIFLKIPPGDDAAWSKARDTLTDIRALVLAGTLRFEKAAQKYSQAPSAASGGDVGFFPYSGVMPRELTVVAFRLKPGEISEPIRSRFGAHLILVTDRDDGDLSVEDARPVLLRDLEREAWNQIVSTERAAAGPDQ